MTNEDKATKTPTEPKLEGYDVVRWHDGGRFVHGVRGPSRRKHTSIAYIDNNVVLADVDNATAFLEFTPLYVQPIEKFTRKAARTLLKAGKRLGITKEAKELLKAAKGGEEAE